ncbi:DUF2723 domain-containing protein [Aureispira anguillae]|uniref:DUF2723 domain-containing protein n=1 Tax=Aureispira anguillae TaxID=2864201 RepID=A0A916DVT6_9BACT|nr:DUF2723 domain-containing protein [Aureispira anguillae]BDS13421.1 DUF2723 domain-containing protein [Aureispira anguillae]
MKAFNRLSNITGWLMFAVAATVYMLTAEPTSSLWDCGEFISAAYKLEVVHPPGAPLFLMIGRMFGWVATLISDDPSTIAYSLNVMSGICTAFLVMFVCLSTIMLSKLAMVGRYSEPEAGGQTLAILGSGVVAGLATTFATSVWFSAVEGEVYAMSSGFTGLVMWSAIKWYVSDHPKADRWLIFIAYMMGLSIGVHLLSLLAFPFLGVLFYYKKKELEEENTTFTWKGAFIGFLGGFGALVAVQYFIIPRLPQMAAAVDFMFVNSLGMGLGTGVLFFILALFGGIVALLRYAHQKNNYYLHLGTMMFAMILIGFSSYGMVVVRANAQAAINMNNPSDPYSMLSYLNREQYGTRPILYGPHFASERDGTYNKDKDVWRPVEKNGKTVYDIVDEKIEVGYKSSDMMFFPRLGHFDRSREYMNWMTLGPSGKPSMGNNIGFFFQYQLGYMYWRYFAWNFIGRQNALQGTDGKTLKGNWLSGIAPLDAMRLHSQSNLPKYIKNDKSRNTYYFLPFIFGLIGLLFHISKRPREAAALGVLFLMTGVAIIVFTNQPPREPRERDYVIVGSIFTFCMWMGMAVPYIYERLSEKMGGMGAAGLATVLTLVAPVIMGYENWDDHSRADQYGARDYAINFLESCAPNAIIFTYGDNDTYPLWYAQEVENIRPDVRVINFSLLAVDWYIDQLRRKINESPKVEMTIPKEAYRGKLRNYLPFQIAKGDKYINLHDVIKFVGSTPRNMNPQMQQQYASYIPARNVYLPVDKQKAIANGAINESIPDSMILPEVKFQLKKGQFMMKDEIALMDIISTNAKRGWERPIYFAVTCRPEKIMGLKDYLMLEGMALRIVPYKTPSPAQTAILMGGVDTDLMYKNMVGTEEHEAKFKWGNFDKQDFFINESYMPSVHSLQYAFIRLTDALIRKGDKEEAEKTVDKFFESFPHMNFPYEQSRMSLQGIRFYLADLKAEEKAQKHMDILADALIDRMSFYATLASSSDREAFGRDIQECTGMMQQLMQFASMSTDEAYKKALIERLQPYAPAPQAPPTNLTPSQQ